MDPEKNVLSFYADRHYFQQWVFLLLTPPCIIIALTSGRLSDRRDLALFIPFLLFAAHYAFLLWRRRREPMVWISPERIRWRFSLSKKHYSMNTSDIAKVSDLEGNRLGLHDHRGKVVWVLLHEMKPETRLKVRDAIVRYVASPQQSTA